MTTSEELTEWLETARNYFNHGNKPDSVNSPFGRLTCEYKDDPDEQDVPYVRMLLPTTLLPRDCFVEIEDNTYGEMKGFRIYLDAD